MTAIYNLVTRQGNTKRLRFRFRNKDGDLIDLSGDGHVISVRIEWSSGSVELTTETGGGLTKVAPTGETALSDVSGRIEIADIDLIPVGMIATWELEHRQPDGAQETYVEGYVDQRAGSNS